MSTAARHSTTEYFPQFVCPAAPIARRKRKLGAQWAFGNGRDQQPVLNARFPRFKGLHAHKNDRWTPPSIEKLAATQEPVQM